MLLKWQKLWTKKLPSGRHFISAFYWRNVWLRNSSVCCYNPSKAAHKNTSTCNYEWRVTIHPQHRFFHSSGDASPRSPPSPSPSIPSPSFGRVSLEGIPFCTHWHSADAPEAAAAAASPSLWQNVISQPSYLRNLLDCDSSSRRCKTHLFHPCHWLP